jgi:alpha-beta hydrolase superfamily lysophospholipase
VTSVNRPFWLPGGVRAALHCELSVATHEGVVMVPPFGWEDLSSYRVRREWAQSLARQGHPTIRLDLPGSGESSDPVDGPMIEAWSSAVRDAARTLRAQTGCARVAAIGLGLGGVTAFAAATSSDVDDVVTWSTATRGRSAVRQLRAFAGMSDPGELDAADAQRIWVAGYSLPLAALTELESIDLSVVASKIGRPGLRALLIGRDGAAPDAAVVSALAATGADVTAMTGSGYDALVEHPQTSTPAKAVFAAVSEWLAAAGERPGPRPAPHEPPAQALEVAPGITERFIDLATPFGAFAAVVTEPVETCRHDLTVVLFNAAATRRIGPNGMWVRAARRAAALGATVVRWDLPGVGDSDGPAGWTVDSAAFYQQKVIDQVRTSLDAIAAEGLPDRFLLAGLCSGAFWSFEVAQDDPRVRGALLLNPLAMSWDAGATSAIHARELAKLLQPDTWRRIVRGEVGAHRAKAVLRTGVQFVTHAPAARRARRRVEPASGRVDPVVAALDRARDNGALVKIVWGREQPLYADLVAKGVTAQSLRWPNLDIELLGGPLGINTSFAPPALQREVLRILDETVGALLE